MLPDGVTQYADTIRECVGGHGEAVCIDCGELSTRRLPGRFPHICAACLFPSRSDDQGGQRERPLTPWPDMLEELHAAVNRRHIHFFKTFGREAAGERFAGSRDHT